MASLLTRRYLLGSALALVAAAGLAGLSRTAVAQEGPDTKSLKGKAAPDFSLKTLDGKDVKLSSLKGKVVLIDFWATWCPPCVKGLPHINEIAQKKELTDKGLVVLAVNVQEKAATVQKFIDAKKLTVIVPLDAEGKASEAYLVQGIPTTIVVGRDGKISEVFVGLPSKITAIDDAVTKALNVKETASAK